ncbi:hypothetical protein [Schlesneria paludicola]|uniref:hypothetical protein n=1 Tax=Schlesneria paludicola TaxID=360056 RepID=UPI00029A7DB2|nr:hypothetical protein [Schlesneria paludicola]
MNRHHSIARAAILCIALLIAVPASGQPPKNKAGDKEKPPERLIYLPYKNLKTLFEKPDGSVLVPYADYLKLWEKAIENGPARPKRAPVDGVISSATYTAKVEKDVVQISATLNVQVLENGWAEIPLRFGDAAIGKLTSDTGKALLRGTGTGTYSLLLPQQGEHTVQLELTARVRIAPEGKSLDLELPSVGITNFEFLVPEADQTIELQPKLVVQPAEVTGKQSRIKASLGATDKVSVRWHPRVGTKPDMELLASVTSQTLVTVEDGLIHTDAWLNYDVLRGQLEKIKLVVPKEHRILDIASNAKVKAWHAVEEDQRQIVSVELLGRVEGHLSLEVHTERAAPSDAFDVIGINADGASGIHAMDVLRESGTIGIKGGNDVTLTVDEQRGLLRIDENEIDAKLKRPGAIYFKYYSPAVNLRLTSKPVQPRLVVQNSSVLIFRDEQLRLRSNVNVNVDKAGVFDLQFKLPEDLTIESVTGEGIKQFDVSADKTMLTVSLREKTLGTVHLTITAARTLDPAAEKSDQRLPLLEPLNAEFENGKVQVYAPEGIEVITDIEKLVAVQPDPAPQAEMIANARLVSSWVYNRRPVEIPVRTSRKATRLTAMVGTTADVKQGQTQVKTDLNYFIEYAPLDTFRFAVPESLADRIQITSKGDSAAPGIKQKSRATTAVDGWVSWTVVLQREVIGSHAFEITYDLVPTASADAKSETTSVDVVRVLDPFEKSDAAQGQREVSVARVIGELTVSKERALSVSATVSGGDAETIDVRELQFLPHDGFVAFRYFKQPTKLELSSNKHDIQSMVETVVSKALVEMVLDRAGVSTTRCRYVLKSSERQRLRVDLPANVEVLGVLVDRKPVALEKSGAAADKGWDSFFVSVARTKPSDEPFTLSILFRHVLNPVPFQNAGGSLALRLPIVGSGTGVAVQQMYAKIWVPPDYSLVGAPKNFSVQTRSRLRERMFGSSSPSFGEPNLDQWIGYDTGGVFEFPTEGKWFQYMNLGGSKQLDVAWWHLPFYTWIVSGAFVLMGFVLRKTSIENKLTLVVVALFIASAYALRNFDFALHGLQVASYGVAAMIAIWLIHDVSVSNCCKAAASDRLIPPPASPEQTPPVETPPAADQ